MTDLTDRLKQAREQQESYRPNDDVARQMKDVTFVALIGITGIGKSHLIPFIIDQGGPDFSELGNISTRAIRSSDPPTFRGGVPFEEMLNRIDRREFVSYVVHPSGDIYASDTRSYATKFVLLPTLTSALPQLEALGCFRQIVPIGLITDGPSWQLRFKDKANDPKLGARLDEALVCVNWLAAHASEVPIINNQTGQEEQVAAMIIRLLKQEHMQLPFPDTAKLLNDLRKAIEEQRASFMSYNQGKVK